MAKVRRRHQACDRPVTLSGGSSGDSRKRTLPHGGWGQRMSSGFVQGFYVRHINNIVEQDHRAITRRINVSLGVLSFAAAERTVQGYEAMRYRPTSPLHQMHPRTHHRIGTFKPQPASRLGAPICNRAMKIPVGSIQRSVWLTPL